MKRVGYSDQQKKNFVSFLSRPNCKRSGTGAGKRGEWVNGRYTAAEMVGERGGTEIELRRGEQKMQGY